MKLVLSHSTYSYLKGLQVEDLDRLLGIYQFWAHNMFPRTQFRDTVDRVERVCRSRRMQVFRLWDLDVSCS